MIFRRGTQQIYGSKLSSLRREQSASLFISIQEKLGMPRIRGMPKNNAIIWILDRKPSLNHPR